MPLSWFLNIFYTSSPQTLRIGGPAGWRGEPGCTSSRPMHTCIHTQLNCKLSCAHRHVHAGPPFTRVESRSCVCAGPWLVANRPWAGSGLRPKGWGTLFYITTILADWTQLSFRAFVWFGVKKWKLLLFKVCFEGEKVDIMKTEGVWLFWCTWLQSMHKLLKKTGVAQVYIDTVCGGCRMLLLIYKNLGNEKKY